MTGNLITCAHKSWALPPLLDWEVRRTGGVPCDSFSASCLWTADMPAVFREAVSFLAFDAGTLLLRGIVDEYELRQDGTGRTAALSGRGCAARLLDNEARPATYQAATLAEILRCHVTPYGIDCEKQADVRASGVYTVSAGSSQWRAVDDFCRTYGGFTPQFTRSGTLVAAAETPQRTLRVGADTQLLTLTRRENHYGVLSEVLVMDKKRNTAVSVRNTDFESRGGCCRRVVYTPGQSTWSAMRYTGSYQIDRSRENEVELELTLPGRLEADPGDLLILSRPECGLAGTYRVAEVAWACSAGNGETTELTVKERI